MPNGRRDEEMERLVERHSVHGAIHALVEVCYRRAELFGDHPSRRAENLREIGRRLTYIEELAARLGEL